MCLLALAWKIHPRWPPGAGRQPRRAARPADPCRRTDGTDLPSALGGRDLESGGTWLGVSEAGRLASITNFRSPAERGVARRSRGLLTRAWLAGELGMDEAAALGLQAFNPFSLIVIGDGEAPVPGQPPGQPGAPLPPGLYGLSNGPLDAPWPKTERLKARLQAWLDAGEDDPQPCSTPWQTRGARRTLTCRTPASTPSASGGCRPPSSAAKSTARAAPPSCGSPRAGRAS
ncbi:MAG: NRDE family protein [Caulobacteraceae bacterium]